MTAAQVGETGRETGERHGVLAAGVARDDFCTRDAEHLRDLVEILAAVVDRNFDQRRHALDGRVKAARTDGIDQRRARHHRRAISNQQRACRRHHLFDATEGL